MTGKEKSHDKPEDPVVTSHKGFATAEAKTEEKKEPSYELSGHHQPKPKHPSRDQFVHAAIVGLLGMHVNVSMKGLVVADIAVKAIEIADAVAAELNKPTGPTGPTG